MRKFRLVIISLCFITCYNLLVTGQELFAQDKIIAIVNNDIITQRDLNDFVNFMRIQLLQKLNGEELESRIESMKTDLISKLIEDRLILHEAKRILQEARNNKNRLVVSRLEVNQDRIKARISEMQSNYASSAGFQYALARQGLTQADIEAKIEEQMLMYNVIDLMIKSKVVITPSEVTEFYSNNRETFLTPLRREVTVIALNDKKLADLVYSQLNMTQDFDEVANKYALKVDKVSFEKGGELKKEIESAIFSLSIGEISSPIKVDDKIYIFRLDNIIMPMEQGLAEVQDRVYAFLTDTKIQRRISLWLMELKEKAYIKIIQK